MKVTVDTNVLVRAAVRDDAGQAAAAMSLLREADLIVLTMPTLLCESVWVLARGYKRANGEIAAAIRRFVDAEGVEVDRPCLRAGLAMLESGGDFADGVIAFEGGSAAASSRVSIAMPLLA